MTMIDLSAFIEPTVRVKVGEKTYRVHPLTLEQTIKRDLIIEEIQCIQGGKEDHATKARDMRDLFVELIEMYIPGFAEENLADVSVPGAAMVFRAMESELARSWRRAADGSTDDKKK